jgi:outer membrane immunogenic protein
MKLSSAFLTTTAILLATSAMAADLLPTYKAPPAPTMAVAPYSWTGFYLGAGGGAAFMNVRSSSDSFINDFNNGVAARGGERSDLGKFGAFGTIEAGADYQMGQFVVGAFTDFDLRSLRASSKSRAATYCNNFNNGCNASATHSVWYKVNNGWDAGVRLGYLVTDRNLLYALGGYTGANVSSGARLDLYSNNGNYHRWVYSSQSSWKSGYLLGAGWQTAITDHISLKTEYRYEDYGKANSLYTYGANPAFSGGARQSGDVTVQSIRVVLDYKF